MDILKQKVKDLSFFKKVSLYQFKISFKNKEKIKMFSEKFYPQKFSVK